MRDVSLEERTLAKLDELAAQSAGRGEPLDADSLAADVAAIYDSGGLPRGDLVGWGDFDEYYSVAPQQWTLVTGVPGMGKSELLDAMSVRLAERAGWTFAVYSPENRPAAVHAVKLLEKRVRKPFGPGLCKRMTREEMRDGLRWLFKHFHWIDSSTPTLIDLLRTGLRVNREEGSKRGVIIDPWNTLDHHDPRFRAPGVTETEYIANVLAELLRVLSTDTGAHAFIVAHPAKMYRSREGTYATPTGYDVAGSAHFFNRADNIIVVEREKHSDTQEVTVYLQKVRFKHVGKFGSVTLRYDKVIGTYFFAPGLSGETYADPERKS